MHKHTETVLSILKNGTFESEKRAIMVLTTWCEELERRLDEYHQESLQRREQKYIPNVKGGK